MPNATSVLSYLQALRAKSKALGDLADAKEMTEWANESLPREIYEKSKTKLSETCKFFKELRDAHEILSSEVTKIHFQIERLSREIIPTMMADEGVTNISVDGHKFFLGTRVSVSLLDKGAAFDWLRDGGHGDIIQETVNAQTLSSFAKTYIADTGQELPHNMFKMSTMKYTRCPKD